MKKESGILTIEASIAIFLFAMMILFFLSFGNVYRAQNIVAHATLQTSQSLAVESFYRESIMAGKIGDVIYLISALGLGEEMNASHLSLGGSRTNLVREIKENFVYSIAENEDEADLLLRSVGVKDGLNGIDFSMSQVKDSNIIVSAKYSVKLQFSFFGEKYIPLSKVAKTKAFKKIK